MALVAFLRGINVGGYRNFRPSILARELADYDVVSVGAAGTFIIRKPKTRAKFVAELRRKLHFEVKIALCDGEDLVRLEAANPFGREACRPDVIQFVSVLSRAGSSPHRFPIEIPDVGEWSVQVVGARKRLIFGLYRRNMKTTGYLGQIDRIFGAPATTRSWSTILSVVRILKSQEHTVEGPTRSHTIPS